LNNIYDRLLQVRQIQQLARQSLTDQDQVRINNLWKDLGDNYFLRSLPEDIAHETRIILEHKSTSNAPLVLKRKNVKGGTEILFFVREHHYLFAETTLFLEQQNLNIVDAYIIPADGECTIGGYIVLEHDGKNIEIEQRVHNILAGLKDVLRRSKDLPFCPINRRLPRQLKHFPVPTRINFTQDSINDHTVMEIITTDRPGVLSRIAQALVICEVRLKKANIGTFGSRVEDVFFITDDENHALYSADKLDCLQEHLSRLLELDVPKNQN
jgi:[protein-PII] uridylyltransferase